MCQGQNTSHIDIVCGHQSMGTTVIPKDVNPKYGTKHVFGQIVNIQNQEAPLKAWTVDYYVTMAWSSQKSRFLDSIPINPSNIPINPMVISLDHASPIRKIAVCLVGFSWGIHGWTNRDEMTNDSC